MHLNAAALHLRFTHLISSVVTNAHSNYNSWEEYDNLGLAHRIGLSVLILIRNDSSTVPKLQRWREISNSTTRDWITACESPTTWKKHLSKYEIPLWDSYLFINSKTQIENIHSIHITKEHVTRITKRLNAADPGELKIIVLHLIGRLSERLCRF